MDVLHGKIRLKEFYTTDAGAMLCLAMADVATLRLDPHRVDRTWQQVIDRADPENTDPDHDLKIAAGFRDNFVRHIDFATPFWVSEQMANLTMHAASSRESGIVSIEDFPTQHGFVWFDKPLVLELLDPDGKTETLSIKIFTWRLGTNVYGQPGMALTYWSQTGQHIDTLGQYLRATGQRPFVKAGPYVVAQQGFLTFGTEQENPTWWEQFAATFVHLIDQEIPNLSEAKPDKKMTRLVNRSKINLNPVIVVTLRHQKADPTRIGTGTSPGVRVLVGATTGGFWRSQPCGPGGTQRKKIWIMPFWRGAEDAPIVWRHDVIYRWAR
jgi:hypothetical protein